MATIPWNVYPALDNGDWWGCLAMPDSDEIFAWEEVWTNNYPGSIVYSTDVGATWAVPPSLGVINSSFKAYAAAYDPVSTTLVIVGDGLNSGTNLEMYYRVAGVWGEGVMPSNASVWHGVAWNGNVFCAVRDSGKATSADGTSWSGGATTFGNLPIVCAHGTTFLVVSTADGFVHRSTNDGASFTPVAMPSASWAGIVSNGSMVVAVGFDHTAYSPDGGLNWTEVAVTGDWAKVSWNGSMFCAIANGSTYVTSADGITWDTPQALPGGVFSVGAQMSAKAGKFYFTDFQSLVTDAVPGGGPVTSPFFIFS